MNFKKALGFSPEEGQPSLDEEKAVRYINLKLAALGQPAFEEAGDCDFLEITRPFLSNHQEKDRLLWDYLCPVDGRVQAFLDDYFKDVALKSPLKLPVSTFTLDRHGLARAMSLPPDRDDFYSDIVHSYRVKQGILHNPKSDRRTTRGVFHIAEGGLPIPDDKKAVPKETFALLLQHALRPPKELMRLPFTSTRKEQAELFISLLLRPRVCPKVSGYTEEKSSEIRFLAPGSLVSNLDFVESIFGNAGDPYLPENDAALDAEHWSGHSGYVILAPHLIRLRKKDLDLPHESEANERRRRDGMCWKSEEELYNDGEAFKVTCRDERGVMVTLIADNYFGYCKKEVKTQISFAANLFGLSEEEHAGGAIAFPSYDLGEEFYFDDPLPKNNLTFKDITTLYADLMDTQPEGYGIDKKYPDILYVPENALFNLTQRCITWTSDGQPRKIELLAYHTYVLPSGYKVHLAKQMGGPYWHLIGTVAEGTLCHKPCTVSGGGKSEISKSIADAMIQGSIFTADFHRDFDTVAEIMSRDFSNRFQKAFEKPRSSRPLLSPKRSLGSVIKLFTPSTEYTDVYNQWLESIPHPIKEMIYVVKRHYRPEWGKNWKQHFGVDMINGYLGHELKYENKKLVANYLRVGHERDGSWRIYKLRQDFNPAAKIQVEDDISVSIVVPAQALPYLNPDYKNPSVKLVSNCEYRLFQRPDDVIHRGYDKQAESDLAGPHAFLSNFEPLKRDDAKKLVQDAIGFDLYSDPIKKLLLDFVKDGKPDYVVSSAHPRVLDGKPSKNPRYLQNRPDLVNHRDAYLANLGARLFRKVPVHEPVYFPVNAVLPGRRSNPPDYKLGIPALAVYNPIHYQELPELFMDFICSVTGKSPSTTGFGSEGALTKGPFNALWTTADLNNALVSYILTGYDGFTSAAGYVGPEYRMGHDISLLIPEIWCRMTVRERDPKYMIKNGYLEKLEDFDHKDQRIQASLLGYRITIRFVHHFCGRIFNNPNAVFKEEMLKPELQSRDLFADGILNIVKTQNRAAKQYFQDGSIESACPPLKALLHIMADGHYEGKGLQHPDIRNMFTRKYLLKSNWYQERLRVKQMRDIALWSRHVQNLETFIRKVSHSAAMVELGIHDNLMKAKERLEEVRSPAYLEKLNGTIGADPFQHQFVAARNGEVTSSQHP